MPGASAPGGRANESPERRRRGTETVALPGLNDLLALLPGADAPGYLLPAASRLKWLRLFSKLPVLTTNDCCAHSRFDFTRSLARYGGGLLVAMRQLNHLQPRLVKILLHGPPRGPAAEGPEEGGANEEVQERRTDQPAENHRGHRIV